LVVLAAASCAAAGGSPEEVRQAADRVIERVRLVATLPRLDFLVRSGRVPGIAGWAGGKLKVNPLFQFRGGGVHTLRPAFSRDAALERILSSWRSSRPAECALHVAALHALADDDAKRLLDAVQREVRPETAFVGEFSPVMVAHTGPGLVGLAWWWG
jgi:DegV family protein with EDD domain